MNIDKNCAYFIAQASHDLRQPLHALTIYLDLFETSNLSTKQKNMLKKIMATTKNFNMLLDNILDVSKAEFGGIKVSKTLVDVKNLIKKIAQEYQQIAKIQNINFTYNQCDVFCYTDIVLLERILRNLLSNAFKFTKSEVKVECKKQNNITLISVCDNGIGIDQEDLPNIFDEFYQGKNIDSSNNGVGLGLSIVKKIATAINAKIHIVSTLGSGSCFSLELTDIAD